MRNKLLDELGLRVYLFVMGGGRPDVALMHARDARRHSGPPQSDEDSGPSMTEASRPPEPANARRD